MTDATVTPAPKKSNTKLFVIIALILGALSLDYYKFHFILGTDVTVTDSTIVVAPTVIEPIDSTKAPAHVDVENKSTDK